MPRKKTKTKKTTTKKKTATRRKVATRKKPVIRKPRKKAVTKKKSTPRKTITRKNPTKPKGQKIVVKNVIQPVSAKVESKDETIYGATYDIAKQEEDIAQLKAIREKINESNINVQAQKPDMNFIQEQDKEPEPIQNDPAPVNKYPLTEQDNSLSSRQKHIIMYASIGCIMVIITAFWLHNTTATINQNMKAPKAEMDPEQKEVIEDIQKSLEEFKFELNQISEASSQKVNNTINNFDAKVEEAKENLLKEKVANDLKKQLENNNQ